MKLTRGGITINGVGFQGIYISLFITTLTVILVAVLNFAHDYGTLSNVNIITCTIYAAFSTLLTLWYSWRNIVEPIHSYDNYTPLSARVSVFLLLWSNIMCLTLWRLVLCLIDPNSIDPPGTHDESLINVFFKSIYMTTLMANGVGFVAYQDANWKSMLVTYVTNVYVSMILHTIVFAKLLNDLLHSNNLQMVPQADAVSIGTKRNIQSFARMNYYH